MRVIHVYHVQKIGCITVIRQKLIIVSVFHPVSLNFHIIFYCLLC